MRSVAKIVFGICSVSQFTFADVRDDIYSTCSDIQSAVYDAPVGANDLYDALSNLDRAYRLLTNGGGTGGGSGVYCKRIRDSEYYAPARISDQEWLQDNGTSVQECQIQVRSSRLGLICSRIRETDFYAPMLVANKAWRGEHGTDVNTCTRQTISARNGIFCQRIRDTDFYAIARIQTGEWMQANGTSIEECTSALGGYMPLDFIAKGLSFTPAVPELGEKASTSVD